MVSCHCFQDRVFDPVRPDAADAYFLATAQNSLLAAALKVPKKNIVKAKMGGADADLLWVAYYVSDRTDLSLPEVFNLFSGSVADMAGIARRILQSADRLEKPFIKALANPTDLKGLADGAYRSVMTLQLGVKEETLDRLEMSEATRKEQVLAIFISQLLADDPAAIFKQVRSGKQTWGQALSSTGLEAKQIETSWQKLLKLHRLGL